MLREVGIASLLVAMIAAGVCLVLGIDPGVTVRAATAAALLPALYGALVQLRIIHDLPARHLQPVEPPGAAGASPFIRSAWRAYAQAVAQLPEVERRRLVPVRSNSSQTRAYDVTVNEDRLRLVPVTPIRTLDGVDERDLIEFIRRVGVLGHVRSAWLGYRFPSGRRCDSTYHGMLCDVLARAGAIANRRKGAAGVLTMGGVEIAERLGLHGIDKTPEPAEPAQPACRVVPAVSMQAEMLAAD